MYLLRYTTVKDVVLFWYLHDATQIVVLFPPFFLGGRIYDR
jgi:hypothetical protein